MSLYDDESLKQEVIHLHSLWHQGPPTRNPIPTHPFQITRPNYIPPADLHLLSRYNPPRNPNNPQIMFNNKRQRPDSGREWPVNRPPSTGSGWGEFKPCKKARPASEEEKESYALNLVQREIHRTCREFFGKKNEETGGDVSDDDDGVEVEFLLSMFEENVKLKEYYVKSYGNGEFWCLVCGGSGEKCVRKFKSCLALVQHSLAISKTDLKVQHRAFAQVVCNVLGWDVNNPVASSQKDSQITVEEVVGLTPELPLDAKPQEKSEKELAKAAVLQMQQDGSEALNGMFAKENDGSVDESEENGGDENLSEELEVVSRMFEENAGIKSYYEENFQGGDFICLVCCAATDKKMIRRFKHCHGIVQHCIKTPRLKKRAHKAFAQFLCELLGWDSESLQRRVVKDGATLVESNGNQNNEQPSSEDQMCEDKAENPQDNNETCVEA